MLVTKQPVLRKFWYATVKSESLSNAPISFTLLGENIVIWRNNQGQPAALKDRCCHRTAKLSKGFVDNEGNISCGYHGWCYNSEGRCTKIPQIEGRKINENIFIEAYKAKEKYGYIWVCLGEPIVDIPEFEEDLDGKYRRIFQFDEKWETSSLRFMENSFDNSHFSFVHKSSFGILSQPKPSGYDLLIERPDGFVGKTTVQVANPKAAYKITGVKKSYVQRALSNQWWIPFIRKFGCIYKDSGIHHIIYNCATPINDSTMQLIQWLYRNDSEDQCSTESLREWDRQILDEDREILEATNPDVCVDLSRDIEKHMLSDHPGLVMRKLIFKLLTDNGETEFAN